MAIEKISLSPKGRPRKYDDIVQAARVLDPGEVLILTDEELPWDMVEHREVLRAESGDEAALAWCSDVLAKRILNALNYGVKFKAKNHRWRVRAQVDDTFTVEIYILGKRANT